MYLNYISSKYKYKFHINVKFNLHSACDLISLDSLKSMPLRNCPAKTWLLRHPSLPWNLILFNHIHTTNTGLAHCWYLNTSHLCCVLRWFWLITEMHIIFITFIFLSIHSSSNHHLNVYKHTYLVHYSTAFLFSYCTQCLGNSITCWPKAELLIRLSVLNLTGSTGITWKPRWNMRSVLQHSMTLQCVDVHEYTWDFVFRQGNSSEKA